MTYLKPNGQLSRESEERVKLALLSDHDPYQCPNTCDIGAAYRMGLVFVAAHLLYGATETPALDSLPGDLRERFTAPEPEGWAEWKAWHDTVAVECPECGAFAYPNGAEPNRVRELPGQPGGLRPRGPARRGMALPCIPMSLETDRRDP